MSHAMTAEELFQDLKAMPTTERSKFFMLLANTIFQEENYTHEQVFGHLATDEFTVQEAADYLEMSVANFRRYVQSGKLKPVNTVGRNQLFATRDLKAFKRARAARDPG